jgi:putative ABC transport system permease protein
LMEAFVLTLLAFFLALFLSELMMPLFNELLNKNYSLGVLLQPEVLAGVILLLLVIAFLAGYYPALNLSAMEPIKVLKGRFISGKSGVQLRKILVVFQFFISISLVLGTFIVLDQLEYMQRKELGFAKDEILVLNASKAPQTQIESFKNEIRNISGVREVSYSNGMPGRPGWIGQIASPEEREEENPVSVEYLAVDENYVRTLGLEVVAGRDFDPNRQTDLKEGLVLNEKAVSMFGWNSPEEALGKRIVSPSGTPAGVVIGVVRDYHQLGLQQQIHGIAMDVAPEYSHMLMVRFQPGQTSGVMEQVNRKWVSSFPTLEYNYFFLNEDFERLYQSEQRLSKMFTLFAALTLLISIIGLLGLVSYMIESRSKELGIRKVLGAGTGQIVGLLSKEFVLLIAFAACIAIPAVWYFGQTWLENFAYRTPIKPVSFATAVLIAFAITFLTVSLQALKAARANTVATLKSE